MSLRTIQRDVEDIVFETGLGVELEKLGASTPSSEQHSRAVGSLMMYISHDYLGLSDAETTQNTVFGLSHDLGKRVGKIPELVESDRKLTPEEKAVVDLHAPLGDDIIRGLTKHQKSMRNLTLLAFSSIIASDHHKPIDTSTYPGEATSLLSLADIFEATHGQRRTYQSEEDHVRMCAEDPADLLRHEATINSGPNPIIIGKTAIDILRQLPTYLAEPALVNAA